MDEEKKKKNVVKEISKGLADQGFVAGKNKIVIKEPIKEAGEYEIIVALEHGLEARLNLIVESDK